MNTRVEKIQQRLHAALNPTHIQIHDDSQSHAGHAGAQSGGGHFYATIVSEAFAGRRSIQRHQMVYAALGEMMQAEIHALSIKAYTPDEFATIP